MENINVNEWHKRYQLLEGTAAGGVIDNAYKAARREIEGAGFSALNDDRAEELIAAITKYVIGSAEFYGGIIR